MNQPIQQLIPVNIPDDDEIDLATYLDILFDNRWLIIGIALVITLLGTAYAFIAKPIYEANILIQVEDSPNSSKNILGDMSAMFDVKTAATSEMEILRSRMIVSRAVDNLRLNTTVRPKYFPVVGAWLAGRNKKLSEPGLFGSGGYAWGAEKIEVSTFNVPESLEDRDFVLTAGVNGQYSLTENNQDIALKGSVGSILKAGEEGGNIELLVNRLSAKPGTQFLLHHTSRLATIEKLQTSMAIAEKGKQSGIIGITLEGTNPTLTSNILNQIGQEYVRQNVERKSEEAEKSLSFLDKQLPDLKRQLEQSESKFNQFRNASGTVDLGEEGKMLLQQSIIAQTKMIELKQKREELLVRFTTGHPAVVGIDSQMKEIVAEMQAITTRIKRLPLLEQDVLRLSRDVKLNTDLYTALLNSAQQLRLVKAGKVGNVRLVDAAMVPEKPIKPNRPIVIAIAVLIGLFLGVMCAFIKKSLFGGISDSHEIEQMLGLTVYANVPHSKQQVDLYQRVLAKSKQVSVLAQIDPTDTAIESLRSFRTSLQFSMLDAKNNIIMITGPTPGLGKSFVSVNVAAVLAVAGKKVLLIDADLRKGYLHQYFGFGRENGLSELVAGTVSLEQAVHKSVVENVDFISTGRFPPNPSELLLHENIGQLLKSLSGSYDYIFIDTPPVLAVSDTLILGPHVGALFMITRAGQSTIGDIKESMKRCSHTGIPVKGVIFNDIKRRPGSYGYGYKYGKYRYTQYKY
ncbi:polysaccharide biosynthesis tyrosine autokinase [Glaciimonas sp. CA11.2]|uniref:polysaccharide biosynthesis tyrosine autokinase n=1 Tax=Glaciimonas sp. CA11.2 TaxID=3048601 RepID=UPI002AB5D5F6|nr:polysaccharide biosynthesis tyrosine autokinase [Glaciimonas sp. CA11.2]MDY7545663.1 polysaccharide biosynthesis tyrosine autokinase [Glaciimonas sp. CA11.2]MEB0161491.1 polysaccharide biosynthesis tyrosine autokinase [Glaciimonas sp. CA11.2]